MNGISVSRTAGNSYRRSGVSRENCPSTGFRHQPSPRSIGLALDPESLDLRDVPREHRFVDDVGGRGDDDVAVHDCRPSGRELADEAASLLHHRGVRRVDGFRGEDLLDPERAARRRASAPPDADPTIVHGQLDAVLA